jgi:hypothetical protein
MKKRTFGALWPALAFAVAILASFEADARGGAYNATSVDPFALYGSEIRFDVLRNGKAAGFHEVRFGKDRHDILVESTFELEIDVLFFTAFRYVYRSEARWTEAGLESLRAEVDDDGRPFSFAAVREGERIRITTGEGNALAEAPLFPTNHWNAGVLDQRRVLNTVTGRVNDVRIEARGREPVETEAGTVMAVRYAYTGDLENEVWYDDAGRWVKMRFKGRDGSTIEYVCRRCQGGLVHRAAK